ncbi:hydrogenase expression/formation protein HypD [Archaeoglobus sulfaticallidus PM70-1]|uniref:Hydrogenase expression/formation protein HypD n=1 Tax=Archaeoglobus sulfaticallidus PM70-1 TaxID=387631 RepID=N0BJF8_9EURY|nr:hydrogenase formation protein HypD [Archaeoglobus sulfaticallidus]AGK60290.1 hydrogenase expression/formation protein HypD [Archaeoglobus sulfaticallidus PM70-1]
MNKKELISKISEKIHEEAKDAGKIKIMHLCGTHEDTITKYNLRSLLPDNIKLLSGPGCPVCIIPDEDLQKVFHLIEKENIIFTTFGDMARVPHNGKSLFYYKAKGYDIRIVYSIFDAIKIARNSSRTVVHFGIGFETTMPSTALAILDAPENFCVFSSHRYFIPAMEHLISLGVEVNGFINPGHVSTITGIKAYEKIKKYGIPQIISGFEPEDVMLSILKLIKAIKRGDAEVFNEYTRAVTYDGNVMAQKVMDDVFSVDDWEWRGLGVVPRSGAVIKEEYSEFDVVKVFEDAFSDFVPVEDKAKKACRCGDVLRGIITPLDCPLFNKRCTPKDPVGACMVSFEGTCNIWAKFGVERN